MRSLLDVLLRLALGVLVGLSVVAVLIGRHLPEPRGDPLGRLRSPAFPRYRGLGGLMYPDWGHPQQLFDTRTGAVLPFPRADGDKLDLVDCSPWRDGHGQYHLVGRWRGTSLFESQKLAGGFGLAWGTFPDWKVHQRVALDPIPMGNPCWYPDASGRVLYPSGGGRLYQFAFPAQDEKYETFASPALPRPVFWRAKPPGRGVHVLRDVHWPDVAPFKGCILASLSYLKEGSSRYATGTQLWWLDLGPDGTEVVAAGRLMPMDVEGGPEDGHEERMPVAGPPHDGTAMLAYLARHHGRHTWELWVTPIATGGDRGGPRTLISAGRKLVEGCLPVAPVFTDDGRHVYAMRHCGAREACLERLPVVAFDDPPDGRSEE